MLSNPFSDIRRIRYCVWLALCCCMAGCTSVFLQPDRVQYFTKRTLDTPAQDTWIAARDGSELHALYLPAHGVRRGTILYLHGNAENLSSHIYMVNWLPADGYAVLALDYRGYGRSQGNASIDAAHEDAESALAWLVAQGASNTGPLIVLGQSLGASIGIRVVARSPLHDHVAAVIADSAFASYRRIAREKLAAFWLSWPLQWPLSLLISDRYAPIDVVADLAPIPLLLIHGEQDAVVDAHHAQALYAAAGQPKALWLVPHCEHIGALRRETVRQRLRDYLDGVTQDTAIPYDSPIPLPRDADE